MSSRELLEQSDRIEPLIGMLLNAEPFEARPSSRQLGTSLGLWYVTLRRAADSGMAAWRALDRPWRGGRPSKRDALARWEAMVDYSSAFTFGAMVLEDFGYCELERRDALPRKKRPNYWPEFVTHVDPLDTDPMREDAIYVDLTLYEGRNVLVVHRRVGHWELHGYSNDGSVRLSRVVVPADRAAADKLLLVAAAEFGPIPAGMTADMLADRLVAVSPRLSAEARDSLKNAYRLGGITPPPFPRIVERVTRLVDRHIQRAGAS